MPRRNSDDLQGELSRSPLSAAYGQAPRAEVWQRIRWNVMALSLTLAVITGLACLARPFLEGGAVSVVIGVVGPLLMAAVAVAAVVGHRRRAWPWSLGALGAQLAWFGVLALLLK
jgi:uncharacterized membrane protein HdeD (DUF308 family)